MDENETKADFRLSAMLTTALGPVVGDLLKDSRVTEIRVNSDGRLWKNVLGEGKTFTGTMIPDDKARHAIYAVAFSVGAVCNEEHPHLSAELPGTGERFQGVIPPVVSRPIITIRKRASKVFCLDQLVEQKVLSQAAAGQLRVAVLSRKNIVIAGGTDCGKTTFANSLLDLMAAVNDRIVIIEDTQELQCEAQDVEYLRTKEGVASLRDLVRMTLRLSPDRIVIGEVRGAEALELLKSWNTGHGGGVSTVHASSAARGLSRLEQLVQEGGIAYSRPIVAEAVNLVVYMEKRGTQRLVSEIVQVDGLSKDGNYVLTPLRDIN